MTHNPALKFPEGAQRRYPSPDLNGNNRVLYVVTCISNPVRYSARYELYKKFAQHVEDSGAVLVTVEQAFGDRPHVVTEKNNPYHIQVRSFFELWHKENMMKLGIQALPDDWQYVAWVDADVMFSRPDWVNETIEQLQCYMFLQMFSFAQDLSPRYEVLKTHESFIHQWYHKSESFNPNGSYSNGHPGYAWAARREALDAVGGLIDWAILGAADRHMACSLIGHADQSLPKAVFPKMSEGYRYLLKEWERRAESRIKRDVGYMAGTIQHMYHGPKVKRGYASRWRILTDHQYNPLRDLYTATDGLYQLDDDNIKLRDAIRRYFRSRQEDSIDEGNSKLLP